MQSTRAPGPPEGVAMATEPKASALTTHKARSFLIISWSSPFTRWSRRDRRSSTDHLPILNQKTSVGKGRPIHEWFQSLDTKNESISIFLESPGVSENPPVERTKHPPGAKRFATRVFLGLRSKERGKRKEAAVSADDDTLAHLEAGGQDANGTSWEDQEVPFAH